MRVVVYQVEVTLLEHLLGTVPKDPEVYSRYIASKAVERGEITSNRASEEVATVPRASEEDSDTQGPTSTGFHQDHLGRPFLLNYQVMGFLKESGTVMKDELGITMLRSKIDQYVMVTPRRIILPPVAGVLARSLRAQTAQGPRVTIVQSDYVPAGTRFTCTIWVLANGGMSGSIKLGGRKKAVAPNGDITTAVLEELLLYGLFRGFGQFRNGGYGAFEYDLTELGVRTLSPAEARAIIKEARGVDVPSFNDSVEESGRTITVSVVT